MEESMMKQKIQDAYFEPQAPQDLISTVILTKALVKLPLYAI